MAPVSTGVWARRRSKCPSGGRDRRRGRGRRRRRARSRPRRRLARLGRRALVVVPRPASAGRIQDFRGDQRHGPRPAQPNGDDHVEHPKRENFGVGRWGVRDGGERQGGGVCGRRTGSPSPAQAFRLAARPFGSTARSSRAAASRIRPGSRLGGRPARLRHSQSRFAAGPSGSPTAKRRSRSAASSALRRRILAEAAALCSASRERNAPAAGGSVRRKASSKASPAPAANSGSPSPALPGARAQAGIGAGGGKAWCSGVFVEGRLGSRARAAAPERAPQRSGGGSASEGRDRRESPAHDESLRGALSRRFARNPPRLSGAGDVR